MVDKEQLVVILPQHDWTRKYIEEQGYRVVDPYYGHSILMRCIREVFFRLKLPLRCLFYNKTLIIQNKVIIVNEPLITADFLKWLHKKASSCKIILMFSNKVGSRLNPNLIDDSWCIKWTSDREDAKKYNMHLTEGGMYMPQWKIKKEAPIYDVFYVGKDKNRLERLRSIENDMNSRGLKSMFYITWERGWQHRKDGVHFPFLPYEDILKYIAQSRSILHLKDGAQDGITLRIQESLINKVKLITDDERIVNYDFYNPNNIFILGKDNLDNIRDFLDSPYEQVESSFFEHTYYEQTIEEIVNLS